MGWPAPLSSPAPRPAVSNRVSRRQAERWSGQDPYQTAVRAAGAGRQRPRPAEQSRVEKLKDLADLKAQGVLNEEEFAAEKARILGKLSIRVVQAGRGPSGPAA